MSFCRWQTPPFLLRFAVVGTALFALVTAYNRLEDNRAIVIDDRNAAHVFDGVGALSAGASSRLLWDYPDQQRGEILDLLFKPQFGASLHILKVEIGGDTQSTDGVEASHERARGDIDCTRGYESWLIQEAKKRNPDILTYGLSWGVPGWVGNGTYFSDDNVQYQVDWMNCIKSQTGVEVDYLGIWNERPWGSEDYTMKLRWVLDRAGFQDTQLVMLDGQPDNDFQKAFDNSFVFRDAIGAVGLHYPCNKPNPDVLSHGKKFWASEEASVPATWGGAGCWGRMLNQNYVRMHMTASIAWSLIWSVYSNLDCFGNGLLYAFEPWSGRYSVNAPVWTTAHTTQFVKPGWRYLNPGSGLLNEGGTYVSLTDGLGNLTVILETLTGDCYYNAGCHHDVEAKASQTVRLRLEHAFSSITHLEAWLTNETHQFVRLADVPVVLAQHPQHQVPVHEIVVQMPVDTIITLTSPGNSHQSKAGTLHLPPTSISGDTAPFPLPYSEDFSDHRYPLPVTGIVAPYFSDQSGAWEVAHGAINQVVTEPPIAWTCNSDPMTMIGDMRWTDYRVTVSARMAPASTVASGRYVAVCVRVMRYVGFSCGAVPGYCLKVADNDWAIFATHGVQSGVGEVLLANGTQAAARPGSWRRLELRVQGMTIEALVDSVSAATVRSTTAPEGMVALQSGWHEASFNNFAIEALPALNTKPNITMFKSLKLRQSNWTMPTCNPNPQECARLRRDFTGMVGARIRVTRPVQVAAIGRWRFDGDRMTHRLLLTSAQGFQSVSWLAPEVPADDDGFAYAALNVALQPGFYDLVSEEFANGDLFYDKGIVISEQDWVEVEEAIYHGLSTSNLTTGTHTLFGPVNLKLASSDLGMDDLLIG